MKTRPKVNIQIGKNLRKVREMRGLSQESVAGSLTPAVSFQQLQKYEKGVNRISVATLLDLAGVLKCNINELIQDVSYKSEDLASNEYDMKLMRQFNLIPDEEVQKAVKSLVTSLAKYFTRAA